VEQYAVPVRFPAPARHRTRDDRNRQLFRRFHRAVRFALPQRNAIVAILALTLLMAAANAAEPLALKFIFDSLGGEEKVRRLVRRQQHGMIPNDLTENAA
jgi:hypothetical protein